MKYCVMSLSESARKELTPSLSQQIDWLLVSLIILVCAALWNNYRYKEDDALDE